MLSGPRHYHADVIYMLPNWKLGREARRLWHYTNPVPDQHSVCPYGQRTFTDEFCFVFMAYATEPLVCVLPGASVAIKRVLGVNN